MRTRRDAATAIPLIKMWRELDYLGNLVHDWREPQTEAALVLGDALIENGFSNVGQELSRFAKRMAKWRKYKYADTAARYKSYVFHGDLSRALTALGKEPEMPKWSQWESIRDRVRVALNRINDKRSSEREWHQKRPHLAMVVRRAWGGVREIRGPFPVRPGDLEDIITIRKWLTKQGYPALGRLIRHWNMGRYEDFQRKGDNIFIDVHASGPSGWRSYTIEPGQRKRRGRGREIQEMAEILRHRKFLHPNLYARKLERNGYGSKRLQIELNTEYEHLVRRFNLRRLTTHALEGRYE